MTLGHRIREARKRKKLSQAALAKEIGSLTRNAVSLWEKGDTSPATPHLLKLAQILDFDPFSATDDEGQSATRDVPILSWVSAGVLDERERVEQWSDVPRAPIAGLGNGDWIALRVDGTSMDRIAPPGSLIIVDRRDRQLINGKYYVIRTEDGSTFKEFRSSPDRFEPYSTMPGHQTIFPRGPVKVVGRVRKILADY